MSLSIERGAWGRQNCGAIEITVCDRGLVGQLLYAADDGRFWDELHSDEGPVELTIALKVSVAGGRQDGGEGE